MIQAEQGEVTGRKVLLEPLPLVNQPPTFTFGACIDRGGAAGVFGAVIPAQLCYNARLPGGERDRGRATLLVGNDSLVTANQFSENFVSDPTANCDFEPETKEACKNEGFKEFDFLGFKNQGDCVSFVETVGKNEPGKSQRKRAISGESSSGASFGMRVRARTRR